MKFKIMTKLIISFGIISLIGFILRYFEGGIMEIGTYIFFGGITILIILMMIEIIRSGNIFGIWSPLLKNRGYGTQIKTFKQNLKHSK